MVGKKVCSVDNCSNHVIAKGMCSMHYYRVRKNGSTEPTGLRNVRIYGGDRLSCSVEGCAKHAFAKTVCQMHYARIMRHGSAVGGGKERIGTSGRVRPAICVIEGCGKPHQSLGYCATHYQRHREGKALEVPVTPRRHGEKYKDQFGYVCFTQRGHAEANSKGRVHEHRAVMAEKLGRKLLHGENVHHINGDRADNRLENLELWVTSQPSGQRPEDLVQWAREILALYGPMTALP